MKKSSSAGDSGQPNVSNVIEHDMPPPDSNTAASPYILPFPVTSRASSAAGVSRPSSAAAVAFQQASVAYHEAVMAKRLDLVQQMQASLKDTSTVAYQSVAAYSHYLEGLHFSPFQNTVILVERCPSTEPCQTCSQLKSRGPFACVPDMSCLLRNITAAFHHNKVKAKLVNIFCCCRNLCRLGF